MIRRTIWRVRTRLRELGLRARAMSPNTLIIAIVVPVVVGAAALAFAILFSTTFFAHIAKTPSDRIALATFWIEFAALPAIGLAVYQFWRAQRGPKLRILLSAEGPVNQRGLIYVGEPQTHPSAVFAFDLLLENTGPVVGRWIRVYVTATTAGGMMTASVVQLRQVGHTTLGSWEQTDERACAFLGNEGYVSYPRPREIRQRFVPMQIWPDTIGRFEVTCRPRYETMELEESSALAEINTTVWADRSSRYDQVFTLLLGQEPSS